MHIRRQALSFATDLCSRLWSHLVEVGGFLGDPSKLTLEGFRLELAELGLLGRPFGPEEYRAALEEHLEIEILSRSCLTPRTGC
jgi:hypothetical protein